MIEIMNKIGGYGFERGNASAWSCCCETASIEGPPAPSDTCGEYDESRVRDKKQNNGRVRL